MPHQPVARTAPSTLMMLLGTSLGRLSESWSLSRHQTGPIYACSPLSCSHRAQHVLPSAGCIADRKMFADTYPFAEALSMHRTFPPSLFQTRLRAWYMVLQDETRPYVAGV